MKVGLPILSLLFLFTSCQYFETEKISSETFYEEDLKTIDWNDVDQYPAFSECEELTEKLEQKDCFARVIFNSLEVATSDAMVCFNGEIRDTIWVKMDVSERAEISVKEVRIDSLLNTIFPFMESEIISSIETLKLAAPAYKRGIPVRTEFRLPIIIESDSL